MKILTAWLRATLPRISVSDRQLADDLTLRGIAVEGVHDLGISATGEPNGHLFEMDITTNRVDAMNHYGIAREVATMYALALPPLQAEMPASRRAEALFPVWIEEEAQPLCGRFTAQVLRGVRIRPSEGRVRTYFELLGQKLISNAVDASNFTLLGMGHPTHAFDLDTIEGGIVVRLARKGETLRLLDGTTRTLEADDLVVADERKALGLAGVMGGWESMITPETKNVLVEAAWFDPAAVRRSARRHGLHTDASHRFERGADFNAAPVANALVSRLILEEGGSLEGDLVDVVMPEIERRSAMREAIGLSVREVQRQLGTTVDDVAGESALSEALIERYLMSLGCEMKSEGEGRYAVSLPSWRLDLEREIDLIEEVARVFGYNRFATTLPAPLPVRRHGTARGEEAVRTRLLALGFTEAISSTFASAVEAAMFAPEGTETAEGKSLRHVAMENPLSAEASLLRPTMLPGMVAMLTGNLNRDVREARLFEQGQVFLGTTAVGDDGVEDVIERPSLVLGMTSATMGGTALYSREEVPIFEMKGAIESMASMFAMEGGAAALRFSQAGLPAWIEPGRGGVALLHGRPMAVFGELARAEGATRKLRQPVYLATIEIGELLGLPMRAHTAREISRYQAVERDFSFVFPDTMQWHTIAATIEAMALPDLQRLLPVEIFRDPKGKAVPVGRHSLLLRVVFQSGMRTLTEGELVEMAGRITTALTEMGGVQRM